MREQTTCQKAPSIKVWQTAASWIGVRDDKVAGGPQTRKNAFEDPVVRFVERSSWARPIRGEAILALRLAGILPAGRARSRPRHELGNLSRLTTTTPVSAFEIRAPRFGHIVHAYRRPRRSVSHTRDEPGQDQQGFPTDVQETQYRREQRRDSAYTRAAS